MVDCRVVGDLEDPGRELVLGAVRVERVERLDEGLLRQVLRQLQVPHQAEHEREDRPLVTAEQLAVGRLVSGARQDHDFLVGSRCHRVPGEALAAGRRGRLLAGALGEGLHSAPMFASDRELPVSGGAEKRAYVRQMFTAIAPTYDRLNRIISMRLDLYWRRKSVERLDWERAPAG